ncbi:hypothetical protein PIB30_004421 [Stylosanthes scabra]|uniref:Uncharacterized protein n=1 Tax=Stylosanthes scabra TaxID=79078 RepID=A0ABU6V1Z9_9FABA|nr:hypothetical protein [Stylosanthes scabra]
MKILEQLDSDSLNKSPNSNVQHEGEDQVELELLEGSLDVAMDGRDNEEVLDGHVVTLDANVAQEPRGHTLDEVMNMEFDGEDEAVQSRCRFQSHGYETTDGEDVKASCKVEELEAGGAMSLPESDDCLSEDSLPLSDLIFGDVDEVGNNFNL